VNVTGGLDTPCTVTTTFCGPFGTAGTVTVICVFVHDAAGIAGGFTLTPPNVTVLVTPPLTWAAPKPVPEIVTVAPAAAVVGDTAVTHGPGVEQTPKLAGALSVPPTVTTTFARPGPTLGTVAVMDLSDQSVAGMAPTGAPPNFTVLLPCAAPKLAPEIVTEAPTAAAAGEIPLIEGAEAAVGVALL